MRPDHLQKVGGAILGRVRLLRTHFLAPSLDFLAVQPRRKPASSVAIMAPNEIIVGGPERPKIDCECSFMTSVRVEAFHSGLIFFRQYVMSLTRKEDACNLGPRAVVNKGPALDTRPIYNHVPSKAGCTGVINIPGGAANVVTMTDFDGPAQVVSEPVCRFSTNDRVALFASDDFRIFVMWQPTDGPAIPLGHVDWHWHARGSFTKMNDTFWNHGVSKDSEITVSPTTVRPGVEPDTKSIIHSGNITQGIKATEPF
jgi:hypothetical protein